MGYRVRIKEGDVAVFVIDGKEVEVSSMTITPSEAKKIIADSDKVYKNRKSRKNTVRLYKKDMDTGQWKVNGESLKFRKDGALMDGRHRLLAVSDSEKPRQFLVVGNLDCGVEDTIDVGAMRSIEDALSFAGVDFEKNAGSIVQLKMKFDKQLTHQNASNSVHGISKHELVDEFMSDVDGYNNVANYARGISSDSCKALTAREVGGLYMHLTSSLGVEKHVVETFFLNLVSTPRNVRNIYTKAMEKLENKKSYRPGSSERTKIFIQCWNSYVAGRVTNNIKVGEHDWFKRPFEAKNVVVETVSSQTSYTTRFVNE